MFAASSHFPLHHTYDVPDGKFWDFTSDLAKGDTAYTTLALGAHTDTTYYVSHLTSSTSSPATHSLDRPMRASTLPSPLTHGRRGRRIAPRRRLLCRIDPQGAPSQRIRASVTSKGPCTRRGRIHCALPTQPCVGVPRARTRRTYGRAAASTVE